MDNIKNFFGDRRCSGANTDKLSVSSVKASPQNLKYSDKKLLNGNTIRNRTLSETSNVSDTSITSNSGMDQRNGKDKESYFWIM